MTIPVVRFSFGGAASDSIGNGRPYVVVYDGACRVCNRLVGLLERWDRERMVEAVPSQNGSVHARFPWIPPEAYAESVQLVGPGGETWQGAAALERLLRVLPLGGALAWIFRLPFAGPLLDRFYRWFARHRYRLGCGEHCQYRPLRLDFADKETHGAASGGDAPITRPGERPPPRGGPLPPG
jgi:predicted DCC family thiol-disulfide oxidoreductase YuxK